MCRSLRHFRIPRWFGIVLAAGLLAFDIPLSPCAADSADAPRETPLSPDQEQATFELADPQLAIELVASEPQLDSPVAISWDGDGRLFVAEMIDYPVGPTSGRIRLVEDRDGDGRYENATVFAEGLNFPNGVLAARGGILVTAAPDILFLKDTDGDGRADEKRVVLTGFGEGNQQLRANGLTWGLDNWVYGANGRSDGSVRSPSDPVEAAVSIRGRDFRFRADGSRFESTTGASQFGQAADDWGNRFLSWNTIPLRHAVFDQAFVDRNARLGELAVRDIADPTDTGQVFPISPRPKTFNRERTDYYNALCGLTIYRGDALGSDYAGNAFVGESLTNLVHRRLLTAAGPTFVSRRGEQGREFLASRDPWFHPVYMATGPDGALYVVDFYRRWVEHPAFVAESLRKGVDWRQGTGHGRIWKISRRGHTAPRAAPAMTRLSTSALVGHLASSNGWTRDTAQRLLVERADKQAAPLLRAVISDSRLSRARLHALGALEGLGSLDDGTLLRALEDAEPRVRRFALRMAASPAIASAMLAMADDSHPLVRFQLAASVGQVEGTRKVAALVKLATKDSNDPLVSAAIAGNLGRSTGEFLAELLAHDSVWRSNPNSNQMRFLTSVATAGCSADDESFAACLRMIASAETRSVAPGDLAILRGIDQGLADRGQSLRALLADPPALLRPRAKSLAAIVSAARGIAADVDEALDHRLAAVELLGSLDAGAGSILVDLLDARHDQQLQLAAAAALAHADAATAGAMFERWQELTTATRRGLLNAALRSRAGTEALVSALETDRIGRRELDLAIRDALSRQRDSQLQPRIKAVLAAGPGEPDRRDVVARFEHLADRSGDRARGAAVFEKHCLACHSVQGRGQRVGPDLSGIGSRPKQSLLVDIFDPSRELAGNYAAYTLVTREGQILSGLIASETLASVTLRRADGAQDVVPRAQIEELRGTGKSLMPEGLEDVITEANLVDLLEFMGQPDAGLFSASR
jgi:putative membrane-bound dehydrogenase-like protein